MEAVPEVDIDLVYLKARPATTKTEEVRRRSRAGSRDSFFARSRSVTPPGERFNFLSLSSLPDNLSPRQEDYAARIHPLGEDELMELEVAPGMILPLRGSDETSRAIQMGFVESTSCLVCLTGLQCIADAGYVLCPDYRVVSPVVVVDEAEDTKMQADRQSPFGVGLGYKPRSDEKEETKYAT